MIVYPKSLFEMGGESMRRLQLEGTDADPVEPDRGEAVVLCSRLSNVASVLEVLESARYAVPRVLYVTNHGTPTDAEYEICDRLGAFLVLEKHANETAAYLAAMALVQHLFDATGRSGKPAILLTVPGVYFGAPDDD